MGFGGGGSGDISEAVGASNLCLNPQFSTVLSGTHTNAIRRNNVASNTQNHEVLGWRSVTGSGSPDISVQQDLILPGGGGSQTIMLVTVAALGGADPYVECRLEASEAAAIAAMVQSAKGKVVNFSLGIDTTIGTANAVRLAIFDGVTLTYGDYHSSSAGTERLFVSATVAFQSTLSFRVYFESTTPDYRLQNAMAVSTDIALTSLPFKARAPINIEKRIPGETTNFSHIAGATTFITSGSGSFSSTDTDINATRPAFAGEMDLEVTEERSSSGNTEARLQPLGGSGGFTVRSGETTGVIHAAVAPLSIGQDGQIQIRTTTAGSRVIISILKWRGAGL